MIAAISVVCATALLCGFSVVVSKTEGGSLREETAKRWEIMVGYRILDSGSI